MAPDNSKNIRPVSSLAEAIRKRPGMYFGLIEFDGVNKVIYEIVANSIDQFLAGLSKAISVKIEGKTIVISDDGPGLPFNTKAPEGDVNLIEYYLTTEHFTPTADNHAPHIHILGGGLGLAIITAACSKFSVESSDGYELWKQEFRGGKAISAAIRQESAEASGTRIEIILDPEVFGDSTVNRFELRRTLFELVHLYPGLTVELENERFYSKNGLLDLAYLFLKKPGCSTTPPRKFCFNGKKDDVQIHVAAIGESKDKTTYSSWVNGCESVDGGAHVKGFTRALKKAGWLPNVALVHVIMHNPRYAGPSKDALHNPEVVRVMEELLAEPLQASGEEGQ